MHLQVHFQNVKKSQWMEQFIERRLSRLDKYLSTSANVHLDLRFEKNRYLTNLVIHNLNHDYAFGNEALNLYESFSVAIDKAARALSEQKRKMKDKMNKSFTIQNENFIH